MIRVPMVARRGFEVWVPARRCAPTGMTARRAFHYALSFRNAAGGAGTQAFGIPHHPGGQAHASKREKAALAFCMVPA